MARFRTESVNAQGKTLRQHVQADDAKAARALLKKEGLVVLSVQADEPQASAWGRPAMSGVALVVWTQQLASLVDAGLPLERALSALADEANTPTQRALVQTLRSEVQAGVTFADALRQHPRTFSPSYVAVVAAGEQSGQLGGVLTEQAAALQAQDQLRQKIISAALYPAIVSLVALVIVIFLMTYVVPQVAAVFSQQKQALPTLTVVMLAISAAIRAWGLWAALALGVAGVLGWRLLRQAAWRLRADAAWLRLPMLGPLARQYHAARFASTLGLLVRSGVPILRALQTAADTVANQAMRADALDCLALVREGAPLGAALQSKPHFPPLLAMFARLGEQTGDMANMLNKVSLQLSEQVQRRALRLATLLEPLMIVTMGLVVMLIVLAVLMPIIELNQFVR